MSKEINLHTPNGESIFESWYTFNLTKKALIAAISNTETFLNNNIKHNFKSGGICFGTAHKGETIISKKDSTFNFEMPEIKPEMRPSLDLGFYPVFKNCENNTSEKFSFGMPTIVNQ